MNRIALARFASVASRSYGSRKVVSSISNLPTPSSSVTPGYCLIRTVTTKPASDTTVGGEPTSASINANEQPNESTSNITDRGTEFTNSSSDIKQASSNSSDNLNNVPSLETTAQPSIDAIATSEVLHSDLPTETASDIAASAHNAAIQEPGPVTALSRYISKFFSPASSGSGDIPPVVSPETIEQVSSQAETVATAAESTWKFSDALLTPAMSILNGMHDITGLPWWLSIVLSTIAIRSMLMPVTIYTMRSSAKMQVLKPDIERYREQVMAAAKSGDRTLANAKQKEMQEFMSQAGIAPGRVLMGPLIQFPVFISFFISIRRLAEADPSFVTGGISWFENLSVMDPYYILPVVCGVTLLGMTELGGDTGQTKMTPQMKNIMRGVGVLSIPMTYWFPAAVFCYWIPNNALSMSLGAIMRRPKMRNALGLSVDPRRIQGTMAFREDQVKQNIAQLKDRTFDPARAAASYVKSSSVDKTKIVKPVLLKTRPKKKKSNKAKARS